MGAWDVGSFDNDSACDWVYKLETATDLGVIEQAIAAVFAEQYIDSDIGSEAVAAIDVLSRLNGDYLVKNSYTEKIDSWVEKNPQVLSAELIQKALKVLELILSENSELAELWEGNEEWIGNIEKLKIHLLK